MKLLNGVTMLTADELRIIDQIIEEHVMAMRQVCCKAELKLVDFTDDDITLWGNMHGTVMDPYPQDVVVHINREHMIVVG